ncbi:hypothetical protein EV140_1767 [Microcella alkaliphila]|uniref:Uncharacterized protein n=1 Tax=Microcella alkaliphila TaxID=279828 RepID=A0A4Q7TF84_9MICO|nr:hypothetical protein [Microcella alkaliphila]RZT59165.1 hypothetical protein EV140_1767 [Microcella alkaliphila]
MASTPRRSPMLAVVGVAMLIAPIAVLSAPAAASGDSRGAHTDVGAFVNPGETVTVEFPYRAEQYQWAVPDGVTTITVELAAGSGGSVSYGDGDDAVGGVGGYLIAQVPVADVPVVSIIVGARGAANAGGGSTAVAQSTAVLAVAGGGGAGWGCALPGLACARGGAGGFSAESGSSAGRDGENTSPLIDLSVAGTGGTLASAGLSRPEVAVESDGVSEPVSIIRAAAIQPDPGPMTVTAGVISPAVGPVGAAFTGGGSGYFAGGHGASLEVSEFGDGDLASREHYSGGGGGGSGFLAAGVDQIEVRDNVGDGFARITYTVPEPDVVDTVEPQLTLGAAAVRAGGSVTLRGSGLDPEREYPVILNSDPVLLGTVTTDEEGAFDASLTIPASVPAGEHVITVGDASIPITVLAAEGTVDAPPTRLIADEGQGGLELAATGADPAAASILGLVAAALLAAGAAAVRVSRRPTPVRQPTPERQLVPARRAATPAQ